MAALTRIACGLVLAAAAVLPSAVAAQPRSLPALTAPVNDFSGVIDAASATELDRISRVLQAATGDVLVVVTIETVGDQGSIEEYAVRLFERAGIGTRASDNGVLLLVAVRDRKVRIEVGYGLEEFVTDGFAGDTIRTHMLPAFREGRYGPGLVAGASVVANRIASGRGVDLSSVQMPRVRTAREDDPPVQIPLALVILILLLVVTAIRKSGGAPPSGRRGRHSTWSGWHGGLGGFGGGFGSGGFTGGGFGGRGGFGGGGGGFGGFGGGRSGGGGASGGW